MIEIDDYKLQMTNSNIHSLNYVNKIISLLFMIIFVLFSNSGMDMFMINLLLFVVVLWSNISIRTLIDNLSFFGIFIFIFLFIVSLVSLNVELGMFLTLKIIDILICFSLVGMTTSYYGLVKGLRFLLKPLGLLFNVNIIAMNLAGFLKIMSVIYSERKRIDTSKRIRGIKVDRMGFIDRIDFIINEFTIVIKYSIDRIDKLKNSLYLNKYGVDSLKHNYRLNKWIKTDTILLIVNVLMLFIILVY